MFSRIIHVVARIGTLFLLPDNTSVCEYILFYSSIHLLMIIWIVSTFKIMILRTSMCKLECTCFRFFGVLFSLYRQNISPSVIFLFLMCFKREEKIKLFYFSFINQKYSYLNRWNENQSLKSLHKSLWDTRCLTIELKREQTSLCL